MNDLTKGKGKAQSQSELEPVQDEELERLLAIGSKSYALKNYEDATENFAKACETFSKLNNKEDPNLLFLYGRALFQVAISSSDVLGGGGSGAPNPDHDTLLPKGITSSSPKPESSAGQGLFQFTGDAVDDDSDDSDNNEENDGENQEEEEESDFETAWDILDLARTLFEKQLSDLDSGEAKQEIRRDVQQKLADIYDILGEISLESENFEQASTDLDMSLKLKEELYPLESTFVSEACFKLSLALELVPERPELRLRAADLIQKAIDSVKKRIEISGENDASLLTDLETRLQELRNTQKTPEIKNELADILGSASAEIKDKLAQAISQVNDISGLVRKKAPTAATTLAGPSNSKTNVAKRPGPAEPEEQNEDQRKRLKESQQASDSTV